MPVHFDSTLLGALRCFDMAGRHLSFTRAAEAMSLTQSAVSQQIRQLEDRLGYPLFVRRQRGLTFTPRASSCTPPSAARWATSSKRSSGWACPRQPCRSIACPRSRCNG